MLAACVFLIAGQVYLDLRIPEYMGIITDHLQAGTATEIVGVNIPTGVPLVYEFDRDFNVVSKRYLGDQDAVNAKMAAVANQGKKS